MPTPRLTALSRPAPATAAANGAAPCVDLPSSPSPWDLFCRSALPARWPAGGFIGIGMSSKAGEADDDSTMLCFRFYSFPCSSHGLPMIGDRRARLAGKDSRDDHCGFIIPEPPWEKKLESSSDPVGGEPGRLQGTFALPSPCSFASLPPRHRRGDVAARPKTQPIDGSVPGS